MTHQISATESELQNLLIGERERCNQYKQHYQTLKNELNKTKDELVLVHQQLKESASISLAMKEEKDDFIKNLEGQLSEKEREIQKLENKVKPHDLNKIRNSAFEEAANHYEVKIKELHAENDKMKVQYNNLHYEHTKLGCTFKHLETEYSHKTDRLKLHHCNEIGQLQSKIESLEKEKSFPDDDTVMKLKCAKHEILQLKEKLKGLVAESEDLRAQNENLTLQLSSTNRTHLKQLADNMSNIRTLECEKQKAVMQKEVLEKELANTQEQRRIMNNELQTYRLEIMSLKSKLEESEHKSKKMATDLQIEKKQLENEYRSEKQFLVDENTRIKSELRETKMELDHTLQDLLSKEQELQQNSIMARQQLWKQSNEFQLEKEKNERKFQDFKNQKEQLISQFNQEIQILQQNMDVCSESKLELEKELITARQKSEEVSKSTGATAIEMLSKQNLGYEQEINSLREQIHFLKSTANVSLEEKDKLLSDVLSRRKADQIHEDEKEILHLKLNWEQQKHQYHQRIEDLESQLREVKNSSVGEKKELECKIQKYLKVGNKLKEKLEIQKVKNEELVGEKEILEKNVPYEAYMQVRNKLTELQRRLEEYRLIVAAEPYFPSSTRSPVLVSDKLLTDIKNLQLRLPSTSDVFLDYEAFKCTREKMTDKYKKTSLPRRRSVKSRRRYLPSQTLSPVITSSSDLELENL